MSVDPFVFLDRLIANEITSSTSAASQFINDNAASILDVCHSDSEKPQSAVRQLKSLSEELREDHRPSAEDYQGQLDEMIGYHDKYVGT